MIKVVPLSFVTLVLLFGCSKKIQMGSDDNLILELKTAANDHLLDKWYPLVLDAVDGGYYSDVTYNFKLGDRHNKMIVTQARHLWTNATAAKQDPERKKKYLSYADHGYEFLRNRMWDKTKGVGNPKPKD